MEQVTLSTKYHFVLPNEIRKKINARPGQNFWILYESGSIKLIPKREVKELFGTLKEIDTCIERDEADRL